VITAAAATSKPYKTQTSRRHRDQSPPPPSQQNPTTTSKPLLLWSSDHRRRCYTYKTYTYSCRRRDRFSPPPYIKNHAASPSPSPLHQVKIDMVASSSSTPLATSLSSPPSQKLTQDNFLFWKALVLPPLRGAMVFGLLDGSDAALAKMIETEDANQKKVTMVNPAYAAWIARDQHVMG
jgi:hypothetical protein